MSCREISPEVLRNARTLEDVYTALGVLRPTGASAAPIVPPRTFVPEGMAMGTFPYLTGTDGRNFNLAPMFANNREQYSCALTTLGYNETRARALDTESAEMDDAAFQTFVNGLSASDALSFNIYRTLKVMEFMRTDPPGGDRAAGGNTDGNRDVISAEEVENWAWERTGHNEEQYRIFGGDAIGRLHALLGIATLLASNPVTTRTAATIVTGTNFDVTAPEGGWRAGDRVMVDTTRIDGAPTSGNDAFRVQGSALPVGNHNVEIRRADGSILRTPVTVSNPPSDPSLWNRISTWAGNNWQFLAGGAGALIVAGGAYMLGRNRGGSSNNPPPDQTKIRTEIIERRGPPPLPTAEQRAVAPVINVNIDNSADRNETRTEGRTEARGSNPPPPPAGAGYDDVLRNLGEGAPGEGVLAALGDGEPAAAPSANPFAEIMDYTVNDAHLEARLREADPALADFYRSNISNAASPVAYMRDLVARMAIDYPDALTQAQAALAAEGRPATEMSDRVMFELVARAANWTPADVTSRPAIVVRFEAAMRAARGVDRVENTEAREARERREREAREGREGERRSPVR